MEMALMDLGLDSSVVAAIHDMLDFGDDVAQPPSRMFVRDNKAMRATAADILDFPKAYVFYVDMPGAKPDQIKVQLEDGNVLMVRGERQRDKEREHKEGAKYVRMERKQGKFLKRFELPENANIESIVANYQDGVLTITVEKRPPPEPKKPKTIEIQVGGIGASTGGTGGTSGGSLQVAGGGVGGGSVQGGGAGDGTGDDSLQVDGGGVGGGSVQGGGAGGQGQESWHESPGDQGDANACANI